MPHHIEHLLRRALCAALLVSCLGTARAAPRYVNQAGRARFALEAAAMRIIVRTIVVSVVMCSMGALAFAQKGNPNPGVIPPHASAAGQSYGEWAGAWWNWALQFPAAQCPIMDPDGSLTMQGQSGHVVFLAGSFGGEAVRSVTVAPGKFLFFPLVNTAWWSPEDAPTETELRAYANASIDITTSLSCTIDGVALRDLFAYRAESPAGGFVLDIPEGSVLNEWGYAAGPRDPAVADGYWIMLTPLKPGAHVIRFTAAKSDGWTMDMTYNVTVAPPAKK